MNGTLDFATRAVLPAVIPVLTGPLTALLALLPYLLLGLLGLLASVLVSIFRPSAWKRALRLFWRMKLPLAGLAAVLVGLVWSARAIWPKAAGQHVPAAETGSDWPLARADLARTGAVPGSAEPGRAALNWVFRAGQAAFFSSPAVVGNRLYIATALPALIGNGTGEIYCLDTDSGAVVWHAAPPDYRATYSSPVVKGRYLVCGEGLHFVRDARVICLDLHPGHEGEVLWTFRTRSHVECTPVIDADRVYVGAGDDGYYCLKLQGDGRGGPQVVWHVEGKNYPDAETALAVHEGRVYAGLGVGGKALCVLDAATGKELKRIETGLPVFSPPAIAGGKLYVGMGNGDLVHRAEEIGLPPAGEVWCIDLETLGVDWKYPVGRTVLGAVAVAGERVYFGSRDGWLYCLSTDGKLLGKFNAHAPLIAAPAVTEHFVYVVAESGILYALDRQSLEPAWEFKLGDKPLFVSSPAVARGMVFAGTHYDGLLAVGRPAQEKEIDLWAGRLGGPGRGGNADDSPLPELGAFLWQYPADQTGESDQAVVAAPPAILAARLFVPLCGTGPGQRGLACLPLAGQRPGDQTPEPCWFYATPNGIYRSPAARDKAVYVVDGQPGTASRQLHAVDIDKGTALWRLPVGAEASGVLLATAGEVLVQDHPGALSSIDLSGRCTWSQDVGRLEHLPAVRHAMLVAAVVEPPGLVALDRPTGKLLWRVELEAAPTTGPVLEKDLVLVGTGDGLECRRLVDGQPHKDFPPYYGGVGSELVLAQRVIAWVSPTGQLVMVSRSDPTQSRTVPGALAGVAPLVARGRLLFAAREALMCFDTQAEAAQPQPWVDISWLGRPTGPMVLAGSRVYLPMAGWGLVCFGTGR